MLSSVIGALGDRVDSKFLTAYWLPAFVLVLGSICAVGLAVGPGHVEGWIAGLDGVEQALAALLVVLVISMVAFMLRALTRPITEVFAGVALPRAVARAFTQGQVRARDRAARLLGNSSGAGSQAIDQQAEVWLQSRFPTDDANLKPTLFGNLLASVSEHPFVAYSMAGALWWPRLSPLLPGSFQDTLAGAQAPMMALLNLSVVFSALALSGVLAGLLTAQWGIAIVWGAGALILSRLAYRAAVSQAAEVGNMLRVAFDLYRYDILDQLDRPHPETLADERALWLSLTQDVLGLDAPRPATPSDMPRAA